MSEEPEQPIRVVLTDASELHAFRMVMSVAEAPHGERQEIEINLTARAVVALINEASNALMDWQHQTTAFLMARLAQMRAFNGGDDASTS